MIDLVTRRARDVRRAVRPVVLALVVALAPLRAIAQQPFTSLTFFGDSYSDTGNLSRLTFGIFPLPPYAPGRFSNGPIWVDRFAQLAGRPQDARPQFFDRGRSGNYAFAGAQTTNTGLGSPSSGLQVINYLTRPGATAQTRTDPTGLYSLFIGGNDLNAIAGMSDPAARSDMARAAAMRVAQQAGLLAIAGARNIMLWTLPSLAITPGNLGDPQRGAILDQLTLEFNTTLDHHLAGLRAVSPLTRFMDFRLDNVLAQIVDDARGGGTRFGITNLTTPCFDAGAPSCNRSLFVDDIHPTARAHAIIADAAWRFASTGAQPTLAYAVGDGATLATPEPGGVVLLATGLATLGAVRRRRRPRQRTR